MIIEIFSIREKSPARFGWFDKNPEKLTRELFRVANRFSIFTPFCYLSLVLNALYEVWAPFRIVRNDMFKTGGSVDFTSLFLEKGEFRVFMHYNYFCMENGSFYVKPRRKGLVSWTFPALESA